MVVKFCEVVFIIFVLEVNKRDIKRIGYIFNWGWN